MAACVSCGSTTLMTSSHYRYYSKAFGNAFPALKVLNCQECNLHQVDHSLINEDKLTDYYRNNYRHDVDIATSSFNGTAILDARGVSLANLCSKHKPISGVKRIFELGAGYGVNLLKFEQVYAGASLHSDDLNTRLIPDRIVLSKLEEGPFDVVILSHVLEHLVLPLHVVQAVIDNLSTGGVLVVEVPNEGAGFIYQQRGGTPFHEPHLTFFSIATLRNFFKTFPQLRTLYEGTAGREISAEEQRRLKLRSGLRGRIRQVLEIDPHLLGLAQRVFSQLLGNRMTDTVDLSDHADDDARLFLRMVLEKGG